MSFLFLDSSALVKRHNPERGSQYIIHLTDPASGNTIVVSELTRVEVTAAIARAQRVLSTALDVIKEYRKLIDGFITSQCIVVRPSSDVLSAAQDLVISYPLRAYDSVQLASALTVKRLLQSEADPLGVTFLSSDVELLKVAQQVGLQIIDTGR